VRKPALIVAKAALLSAAFVLSGICGVEAAPESLAAGVAQYGHLAGGGQSIVEPLAGTSTASIALWYRAPVAGFAPEPLPGVGRLAAEAVAASTAIDGTSLIGTIEGFGGRLTVAASPESIAITAVVPSNQARATVRVLTRAFFAPVLDKPGLDVARHDDLLAIAMRELDPRTQIDESLYEALFSSGPARVSTWGAPKAISEVSLDTIRSYAQRAFRAQNAIVVATGAVDASILEAATPAREGAQAEPELPSLEPLTRPGPPMVRTGGDAGFGLAWVGPPISAEAAATAFDFVVDYAFNPDDGVVTVPLASAGTTIVGNFVTYHDPGVFIITATGGDIETARGVLDQALSQLHKPLDPQTFERARRHFLLRVLMDQEFPAGASDTLGWYAVEGNPAYAPSANTRAGRYFQSIAGLTPEFVAQTVTSYLDRPGVRLTVKPGEVHP
jgi:predicted Zn-dependent peptidase